MKNKPAKTATKAHRESQTPAAAAGPTMTVSKIMKAAMGRAVIPPPTMKREEWSHGVKNEILSMLDVSSENRNAAWEEMNQACESSASFTFGKSASGEISRFLEAWNNAEAEIERAVLIHVARVAGSPEVARVIGVSETTFGIIDGARVLGNHFAEFTPNQKQELIDLTEKHFEKLKESCCLEIGKIVTKWLKERNATALRALADAVEGKGSVESQWKQRIMSAFYQLAEGKDRLPTKGEIRGIVEQVKTAGDGLDDRRFRRYLKVLGLSGLPSGKPGPRGK